MIDASWHLPNSGRIGAAEFRAKHIPGAVFFDIDTIADHDQGLPHMLPKPEALAKAMTALGLGDGMRFVVYDTTGLYAAARVWWMLRAYRVEDVRILDGGLPRWIKEGRPLETGDAHPKPRPFTPRPADGFVASLERSARGARDAVRRRWWTRAPPSGSAAKPRSRGPASEAAASPAASTCRSSTSSSTARSKPPAALKAAFAEHGIDLEKPIITTCGSGVTAAILALAVEEAGGKVAGLYDGSWAEWGSRADCPVATGPE